MGEGDLIGCRRRRTSGSRRGVATVACLAGVVGFVRRRLAARARRHVGPTAVSDSGAVALSASIITSILFFIFFWFNQSIGFGLYFCRRINHGNGNGRRASLWNDFWSLVWLWPYLCCLLYACLLIVRTYSGLFESSKVFISWSIE